MSLGHKIYLLWSTLCSFRKQAAILFLVMLFAALSEALGIGMIIPLLTVLLGSAPAESVNSEVFSKFARFLTTIFSEKTLLFGIASIFIAVFFTKMVLVILRTFLSIQFVNLLRRHWMSGVLERYLFADYSYMMSQEKGVLLNNLTHEPTNAAKALHRFLDYSSELIVCFGIYAMMFIASWQITMVLTGGAVIILVLFWGVSQRYSLSVGRKTIMLNQSLMARAEESLNALREVKAFALEKDILRIFKRRMDELLSIVLRFRTYLQVPVPAAEFFVVLIIVAGLLYARYGSGVSALAALPLLAFFAVASQKLYLKFSRIFSGSMSLASFLPSLDLVHNLMTSNDLQPKDSRSGRIAINKLDGDIVFDKVSYSYPNANGKLFEKISLRIPKGGMVGIVGQSGSGKSTLADLLCGLYPRYEGGIRIGRYDLRELDPSAWHKKIGLVTQEPFIFNTSIRENIMLGRQDVSEKEMVSAAIKAHAHEFIERLPEGYDTVVADRGTLSVGQKQRIAIARVILRDPEIYIFDEATSALDADSEKYIQAFIDGLGGKKTVLFISHRHNIIKNADIVYVLDHGRIVDSGLYHNLRRVAGSGASGNL